MKNTFFVAQIEGTQHILRIGDIVEVNHIEGKVGDKIDLEPVLLVQGDDIFELGSPSLDYSVSAEIVRQYMGPKIDVFKYKAKSRYKKTKGHRQFMTSIKILKLNRKTGASAKSIKPKSTRSVSAKSSKK